ncbi:MAG: DNA recombination protein RmuC [Pseudomonadota bacterium]
MINPPLNADQFVVHFWPLLLLALALLVAAVSLLMLYRSRNQLHEWISESRLQQREYERNLNSLLVDTREDMLRQVEDGQRAEQQMLLLNSNRLQQEMERRFGELLTSISRDQGSLQTQLAERLEKFQHATSESLSAGKLSQQQVLSTGIEQLGALVNQALLQHGESLGKRVHQLMESTDQRLREISGRVDERLSKGFEKTTQTFTQVLEHLNRIDEAQKRIAELSSNVMTLQELLSDKRSRGAFGEMQLAELVENLLPRKHFSLQQTLGNGTRVDCLLRLPEPTGNVAVDAKFPLESFQSMTDQAQSATERLKAGRQFRQDIKKHIADIASKYIIQGETADGAMMFIPAEAVFAEIHAHHPNLVEEAQHKGVWLVSPTTMMAVLTTARAVLRDVATQKQVHVIREHLYALSKDFERFHQRMEKLSQHISQAHQDVEEVQTSARRISNRFHKIDQVEMEQ